ncbi:MAG: FkbM family methyltransferase [Ferruginibacter sp.]|nr:FkbM family methyltransferase [Ferruginibacter sp.]
MSDNMSKNSFIKNIQVGVQKKVQSALENPYRGLNMSWAKIKYYKHLPPGKIRSHKLFNHDFYFYSATELLHGLKEIFVENIYRQKLQQGAYILDCGANIGMSIVYLKTQFPDAKIIAFEPDETNFNLLQKNIGSFGYSNVELHKAAVWSENTTLLFSNESSMGSKVETSANENTIKVSALRLKDFIDRDVDFLKIDIEGAEYVVLEDIAEQLHFVKNMFLEYHGTFSQNVELARMIEIIKNAGLNFYIKEAAPIYPTPFDRVKNPNTDYDVQLNIFCFRN